MFQQFINLCCCVNKFPEVLFFRGSHLMGSVWWICEIPIDNTGIFLIWEGPSLNSMRNMSFCSLDIIWYSRRNIGELKVEPYFNDVTKTSKTMGDLCECHTTYFSLLILLNVFLGVESLLLTVCSFVGHQNISKLSQFVCIQIWTQIELLNSPGQNKWSGRQKGCSDFLKTFTNKHIHTKKFWLFIIQSTN